MGNKNILMQLVFMDERAAAAAINNGFSQYAQFIVDIYNDIYDSCIEVYYSTYTPTKYDRHGDLEGFNLYSASDIYANQLMVNLSVEGYNLLPYAGKTDKRDQVLQSVMNGLRGSKSRKTPSGWPMNWSAYYPNEFSEFSDWSSSASTLYEILNDFANNGVRDTADKFYYFIGINI